MALIKRKPADKVETTPKHRTAKGAPKHGKPKPVRRRHDIEKEWL